MDNQILEYDTKAVTGDVPLVLNQMSLAGWEHYQTVPGAVDGDRFQPIGLTLFFRRPRGYGGKGAAVDARGRGKR